MRELLEPERPVRGAEWVFAGFVATLLCVDVLLLVVAPADATAGLVRGLLAVGAWLAVPAAVVLGVVHRPVYAVGGLLAAPVVAVYAVSGLLLPWNRLAFYAGQQALDALLAVPVFGERLATLALGGPALSQQSLRLAFRYHYAVVGVGVAGLGTALAAGAYGRYAASGPDRQ
ncbi:hypothetical protein [Halobacterium yunchengense]|uniref:hypothetical protein n=1 Tax=Halobacterium yunchengense TaxID=3108497 RepID=UPI00300ADB41